MNKKEQTENRSNKRLIAFVSVALSVAGIITDLIMRRPVIDTFSIGFVLTFAGFLLSLASVKDRGDKLLSMAAFWLGFAGMWITVLVSLM